MDQELSRYNLDECRVDTTSEWETGFGHLLTLFQTQGLIYMNGQEEIEGHAGAIGLLHEYRVLHSRDADAWPDFIRQQRYDRFISAMAGILGKKPQEGEEDIN